jgi:hypothetical protein
VPLALFAVTAYLVLRSLKQLASTDTARLEAQYAELYRKRYPRESEAQLIERLIRREALRTGVIGAVTGFGGFFTLILGLPIDMLTTARIQAQLVAFVAQRYGREPRTPTEQRVQRYLIMAGGAPLNRWTGRLLLDFATRFVSKALAKFIPFIGAFLSFGVNYFFTQATGRLALEWYSGNLSFAKRRLAAPPPEVAAQAPEGVILPGEQ